MTAERIRLPKGVDRECVALCRAINRIPGLRTVSSCCGHGDGPFHVWLEADAVQSLYVLARCFDIRYGCPSLAWRVEVNDVDSQRSRSGRPGIIFHVTSGDLRGDAAYAEADKIAENIVGTLRAWHPAWGDRKP